MPHYATRREAAAAWAAGSASCQTHAFSCEGSQYYAVWPLENAWPASPSCTGTSRQVWDSDTNNYVPGPACDLDAATDGTADCPDGCDFLDVPQGWSAAESGAVCEWAGVSCAGSRATGLDFGYHGSGRGLTSGPTKTWLSGDGGLLAGATALEESDPAPHTHPPQPPASQA